MIFLMDNRLKILNWTNTQALARSTTLTIQFSRHTYRKLWQKPMELLLSVSPFWAEMTITMYIRHLTILKKNQLNPIALKVMTTTTVKSIMEITMLEWIMAISQISTTSTPFTLRASPWEKTLTLSNPTSTMIKFILLTNYWIGRLTTSFHGKTPRTPLQTRLPRSQSRKSKAWNPKLEASSKQETVWSSDTMTSSQTRP